MKKKHWKKIWIASLSCAFVAGAALSPALSAGWIESIQVRSGIGLNVNGETVKPVDASGKEMPIFLYDSTTYVPVRCLSEQYGKQVDWDPESATVFITDPPEIKPDTKPEDPEESFSDLNDLCNLLLLGKEDSKNNAYYWQDPVTHEGKELEKAIALFEPGSSITFKLDQKYSRVHFDVAFLNNGFDDYTSLRVTLTKSYGLGDYYPVAYPTDTIYHSSPAQGIDYDLYDTDFLTISTEGKSFGDTYIYSPPCVLLIYNAKLTPITTASSETGPAA